MDQFLSLNPEKQERILNAALKEFAKKGYKNAMTDEIAKGARISKGALFQYFKNKKQLFLFLYDRTLNLVMKEFLEKIDLQEKDILNRLRQVLRIEFLLLEKYPDLFDFIEAVNREEAIEVIDDLKLRNKEHTLSSYRRLAEGIDTSRFKADVEIDRAMNVILWTMEGFGRQEKEKIKGLALKEWKMDAILGEADIYLELLRDRFYR